MRRPAASASASAGAATPLGNAPLSPSGPEHPYLFSCISRFRFLCCCQHRFDQLGQFGSCGRHGWRGDLNCMCTVPQQREQRDERDCCWGLSDVRIRAAYIQKMQSRHQLATTEHSLCTIGRPCLACLACQVCRLVGCLPGELSTQGIITSTLCGRRKRWATREAPQLCASRPRAKGGLPDSRTNVWTYSCAERAAAVGDASLNCRP